MKHKTSTKKEVLRVDGKLKEIVTIHDDKGRVLHKIMNPLMVEFHLRDLVQVMVGASVLAIPVAFTEETWRLGEELGMLSIIGLLSLSLLFITIFVYYNYYREKFKEHWVECVKRVLSTYIFSFLVVTILLVLINRAPWITDGLLAFKRAVLVAFPASMSASIADMIK